MYQEAQTEAILEKPSMAVHRQTKSINTLYMTLFHCKPLRGCFFFKYYIKPNFTDSLILHHYYKFAYISIATISPNVQTCICISKFFLTEVNYFLYFPNYFSSKLF